MTVTVVVVDDHEIVRRGVRAMLSAEPDIDVVADVGTYDDAVEAIVEKAPDVAVVDVRLHDDRGDGIDLCDELAATAPGTRCVMLTSYADEYAVVRAYEAGAAAFVLKEIGGTALADAVRDAGRGESRLDAAAAAAFADAFRESVDDTGLTPQERRVVECVSEGLTNREIATRLALSDKTVKNYVSNVLTKLGMAHRSEVAVYGARMARRTSFESGAERNYRAPRARASVGS